MTGPRGAAALHLAQPGHRRRGRRRGAPGRCALPRRRPGARRRGARRARHGAALGGRPGAGRRWPRPARRAPGAARRGGAGAPGVGRRGGTGREADGGDTAPSRWEEIAADLARDADVYGTHPYATSFRALNIAVAALPGDLRAALLGLAVFPPDTAIPVSAIARYWAAHAQPHRRGTHRRPRPVGGGGGAATRRPGGYKHGRLPRPRPRVPAPQHPCLPALHAQLLDAYRVLLDEPEQWWTLPLDEPYMWEHLAGHLAGAGDRGHARHHGHRPRLPGEADRARRCARGRDGPGPSRLECAPDDPDRRVVAAVAARGMPTCSVGARTRGGSPGRLLVWLDADAGRPTTVAPRRLAPLLPRRYLAARGGVHSESSALVRVLTRHTGGVNAVAWSPDGSHLATGGDDGVTFIWDSAIGQPTVTLTGHAGAVQVVVWSPYGTHLATGGWDGTVRIYDPVRGTEIADLYGHTGPIHAVAWSPDGTQLATAGDDDSTRIWSLATGCLTVLLDGHTGAVWTVAWSPDGTHLATGSVDRTARGLESSHRARDRPPHRSYRRGVDGGLVPPNRHRPRHRERRPDCSHLGCVERHPERHPERRYHLALRNGLVLRWRSPGHRRAGPHRPHPRPDQPTPHRDGHRPPRQDSSHHLVSRSTHLATADNDGAVRVHHLAGGRLWLPSPATPAPVQAVAWSPDSTQLATGSEDGTVRIWNPTNGQAGGYACGVRAMAWSADGAHIAVCGDDGTLGIWDLAGGTTRALSGPDDIQRMVAMAWSRDGTRLATVGKDYVVRIHDPITGVAITALGRGRGVVAVDWSPDGTQEPPSTTTAPPASGTAPRAGQSPLSPSTPARYARRPGLLTAPDSPPAAGTAPHASGTPPPASHSPASRAAPSQCARWPGLPTAVGSPPSTAAPYTSGIPLPAG